jgi:hypothetical protein
MAVSAADAKYFWRKAFLGTWWDAGPFGANLFSASFLAQRQPDITRLYQTPKTAS